jgi:hypothetical protein
VTDPINDQLQGIVRSVDEGHLTEEELRLILAPYFGQSRYAFEPKGHVDYLAEDGSVALTAVYDGRVLVELQRGPILTDQVVTSVATAISAEVSASQRQIRRFVLFASVPTEGQWRYRDQFQLLPAPPHAPHLQQVIGDHPLILEVSYKKSDNWMLNQHRAQVVARTIELLLALFLRHGIHTKPRYSTKHWMLIADRSQDDLKLHSEYLQVGFYIDGFVAVVDDFTESEAAECEAIPDEQYYSQHGISVGDTLTIPALMAGALDCFFSMDLDERSKFLRACYWFALSGELWPTSHSASFTALVQSIEVLVPRATGGGECPSCKKQLGPGPTRLFSDFVETYASNTDEKERRRLYGKRSALSHGNDLLVDDEEVFGFGETAPAVSRSTRGLWADARYRSHCSNPMASVTQRHRAKPVSSANVSWP